MFLIKKKEKQVWIINILEQGVKVSSQVLFQYTMTNVWIMEYRCKNSKKKK